MKSRGGRPGLPSLTVSVDVKQHWKEAKEEERSEAV